MTEMISQHEVETMIEKLTSMFDHIRNTFINASQLADKVNELSAQVARLQQDVEQTASANAALTATVQSLTDQRNAVVRERDELSTRLYQVESAHSQLQSEHAALQGSRVDLTIELDQTKSDRDNAHSEARRLLEDNDNLRRQLQIVEDRVAAMQDLFKKPEQPRDDTGQFASNRW